MNSKKSANANGLDEAPGKFIEADKTLTSLHPKHIVAIGASAGGLDPLQIFFDVMDSDSGMAFVVVQHLSPDYKSLMVELLARHTDMHIHRVTDQMEVEANSIYLIPAGKEMIISNRKLLLSDREEGGHLHLPIDTFFKSLAQEKGNDAVAIIMSGSGSDGRNGAEAIRKAGGFVLVQAPETAKFDGMPNAAINARIADFVIAPSDMPAILKRHNSGERLRVEAEGDPVTVLDPLRQILDMLRKRFGPDFGYYKDSTVGRRIKRRAGLKRAPDLIDYVQLLKESPNELEALYHDLLIGVTAFFRDKEAFSALEQIVIPQISAEMDAERPLRIWIPACATGEEAYSIAILLAEYSDRMKIPFNLKIFATDVHDGSLQTASEGLYKREMLSGVSEDRLRDFFEESLGGYRISNRIRRCVVFSRHNILRDPPFTKMDLISCRNLLIYFTDIAQRKVLSLFHFALRRGAFLFLGSSETVSKLETELEAVDSKQRIYRKIRDVRLPDAIQLLPVSTGKDGSTPPLHVAEARTRTSNTRQVQAGYDLLLKQYAPASLLVDAQGDVLHVFGNASDFLRLPGPGLLSSRAVDLVRSEFSLLVGPALDRTLKHGIRTVTQEVQLLESSLPSKVGAKAAPDGEISVQVVAEPLKSASEPRPYFALLMFEVKETEPAFRPLEIETSEESVIDSEAVQQRIAEMEHQLKSSEENLQTTIEELETSNEELQAANEELQASNEELQSTNEELHSVNEELHTVSAEHESKIAELSQLNQDVDNLLRSTEIGTVFVDQYMRIRKFTPAAAKMLNLVAHDIGRLIGHVTYRFGDKDFYELVKTACDTGRTIEREIMVDEHGWFLLRIHPYRQDNKASEGAVITFVDVDELRKSKEAAWIASQRMEDFLQAATDWLWETDHRHRLTFVTEGISALGIDRNDAVGERIWSILNGNCEQEPQWQQLARVLNSQSSFRNVEVETVDQSGNPVLLSFKAKPLYDESEQFSGYRGTTEDITERRLTDLRLSQAESRYRYVLNRAPVMLHSTDGTGSIVNVSDFWLARLGYDRSEIIGEQMSMIYDQASRGTAEFVLFEVANRRHVEGYNCKIKAKSGDTFDALLWAVGDYDENGNLVRTLEVLADVTELRRTTADLATKNAALLEANGELERFNYVASHDLRSPLRSCNLVLNHLVTDLEDKIDDSVRDQFRLIGDRLVQMEKMLGNLLDYAQVGRDDLVIERLQLNSLVETILEGIEIPDGILVKLDLGDIELDANPTVASHVLKNLIENAVVHHDTQKGKIEVSARRMDKSIEITVSDDGPGIDPIYYDKVFELFGRISSESPGEGMGLALIRRTMSKIGGSIRLISEKGQRGCRFVLVWPQADS